MAKGANQKLKLLYLMKILLEKTDENHSITMQEIITSLEAYGVSAERKSIYDDIEALRVYGLDIVGEKQGKTYNYRVCSRIFEIAELKLLVDSVQSSRFITLRKSNELIKKLEQFASKYEANQLHRQVYVSERIKTMNESIYYNVDKIHAAISSNVKITFQYFQWNVNKEEELRRNGEYYCISPWALSWNDENYYLIGYDSREEKIKHYRVDKMLKIDLCEQVREGKEHFEAFDIGEYSNKMFSMFGGIEESVKLLFRNDMAGIVIDRFGKDVPFIKKGDKHFQVNVMVAVSNQFLSWIISLGDGVRIMGPETVIDQMRMQIKRLEKEYR